MARKRTFQQGQQVKLRADIVNMRILGIDETGQRADCIYAAEGETHEESLPLSILEPNAASGGDFAWGSNPTPPLRRV
ncbi:MAG TPA: hypothetical protein VG055_01800 [Planctomycetaceae bacterium]|nr:hypothetical protein [Planctomycetaceae bacterium]